MRHFRGRPARWAGVAAVVGFCGCFSSTWGQEKAEQRRVAEDMTPEGMETRGGAARPTRPMRLRVHATPRYEAEVVHWASHFRDWVDRANQVTGPDLGIRLEVAETRTWSPDASIDDLDGYVKALAEHDSGDGADLVVGLVGSLPRLTTSFEDLGKAMLLGKHFVLRATNDVEERRAIRESLHRLSEDDQKRLYRVRKSHKETVLLIHEVGHTLGAIHVPNADAVMHPSWTSETRGYAPQTLEIMRVVLEWKLGGAKGDEGDEMARAVLEKLRAHPNAWIESERRELMTLLRGGLEQHGKLEARVGRSERRDTSDMTPEHHDALVRATSLGYSGRSEQAWQLVAPLVDQYPDVYAVQELACHLAMQRGEPESEAPACRRRKELAGE